MDKTQKEFVVHQIKKNGFITRNQCLRNYISRLGAIIFELKKEGFQFDSYFQKNDTIFGTEKDFVYKWTNPTEDVEIKTEFTFFWIDESNNETPFKVSAKSFKEASEIFLMQPPIFMWAIAEEVEDNLGSVFNLDSNPKFNEFRTYTKPKKRAKNEN